MNCVTYLEHWNDRFDSPHPVNRDMEILFDQHESQCPECRRLGQGFRRLGLALPLPRLSESPSDGFADRVLREISLPVRQKTSLRKRLLPWAVAASLLVGLSAGRYGGVDRFVASRIQTLFQPTPRAPEPLAAALTSASKATWSIAHETTASVARVSNDVLGSAKSETTSQQGAVPVSWNVDVRPPSDAFIKVGQHLNDRVGPLTGTARSAFGFLLGPATERKPSVIQGQTPAARTRPRSGA